MLVYFLYVNFEFFSEISFHLLNSPNIYLKCSKLWRHGNNIKFMGKTNFMIFEEIDLDMPDIHR